METSIGIKIPNKYADKGGKKKGKCCDRSSGSCVCRPRRRKRKKKKKKTTQTKIVHKDFNQPLFGPRRSNASSFASRALMIGGNRRPFVFTPRALAHSRRNYLSNVAVFTKPPVSAEAFARTYQTHNIYRHLQQTDNYQQARQMAGYMGQRLGGVDRVRGRRQGVPAEAGIVQGVEAAAAAPEAAPQAAPQEAGFDYDALQRHNDRLQVRHPEPPEGIQPRAAIVAERNREIYAQHQAGGGQPLYPRPHPRPRPPRQPSRADRDIAAQETITRRTRGRPKEAAAIPSYEGDAPAEFDDPDDPEYEEKARDR